MQSCGFCIKARLYRPAEKRLCIRHGFSRAVEAQQKIWALEPAWEPKRNRRSLHCSPPDFLLRMAALIDFVRLSLRRVAYVVLSSSAM
jgi:hypothetical protein